MNDLQAAARERAAQIPVSNSRGAVERFGFLTMAAGVLLATLVAWVLTKVPWSWAHETGFHSAPLYGTSTRDIVRSMANSYSYQRHVAAQGSFYVGIGLFVLGVVIVLVGKALPSD